MKEQKNVLAHTLFLSKGAPPMQEIVEVSAIGMIHEKNTLEGKWYWQGQLEVSLTYLDKSGAQINEEIMLPYREEVSSDFYDLAPQDVKVTCGPLKGMILLNDVLEIGGEIVLCAETSSRRDSFDLSDEIILGKPRVEKERLDLDDLCETEEWIELPPAKTQAEEVCEHCEHEHCECGLESENTPMEQLEEIMDDVHELGAELSDIREDIDEMESLYEDIHDDLHELEDSIDSGKSPSGWGVTESVGNEYRMKFNLKRR